MTPELERTLGTSDAVVVGKTASCAAMAFTVLSVLVGIVHPA